MRIASYNVLADAYVKPEWFAHVSPAALAREPRRARLIERVIGLDADVVCLQEVEAPVFAALERALAPLGHRGVFAKKSGNRPDGCATFVREQAWTLVAHERFVYRDGRGGVADSGHVALLVTVAPRDGGDRVVVAGTHLRWAADDTPPHEHVGRRQLELLLAHLDESGVASRVVCGDFNAEAESTTLAPLFARGYRDAYAARPQPTCNTHHEAKRIDFVFHDASLRAVPEPLPAIDGATPLPSDREPSDHLPIVATLERD